MSSDGRTGSRQVDVALTRRDVSPADTVVVVDCIRATTVIAHALAAGYEQVHCVEQVERAIAFAVGQETHVLGGERDGLQIEGFALGNSPAEYEVPLGTDLVFSTTNGTRAIVAAAACGREVLCAALVNLEATCRRLAGERGSVLIVCAGVDGQPALDDTYVAGRIVTRLEELDRAAQLTDSARIARHTAAAFASPQEALASSRSARNLMDVALEADVRACARESTLSVVPHVVGLDDDGVVHVQ